MKKILMLIMIMFIVGCANLSNTPTKRVEELLNRYQTLDKAVIDQLDEIVNKETNFNNSQKELYKDIIKEQYKNLTYDIKDEEINGDKSVVTVQINVKDFSKALESAEIYYNEHRDEFIDNNGEYESKYIDYRLEKLKDANEKVSYTLEINLTKTNSEWSIDGLTSADLDKISGVYNY